MAAPRPLVPATLMPGAISAAGQTAAQKWIDGLVAVFRPREGH